VIVRSAVWIDIVGALFPESAERCAPAHLGHTYQIEVNGPAAGDRQFCAATLRQPASPNGLVNPPLDRQEWRHAAIAI
jgi:hypothetical protein